jgi:N-acetylglucosaminyl-diphospho-decaprenol L-rhamnosyltransferase
MTEIDESNRLLESAESADSGQASAPTAIDVSILVVAYNSASLIEACISSIAPACTRHRYEILLIDNGDGSTEALVQERFAHVKIVPSRGNIGFAAGNNALADQAHGAYILLLNPDMKLFPGAIDALFEGVSAHPQAVAWGGVTVDAQGRPDTGNSIPKPSLAEFASSALGRSLQQNLRPERLESDAEVKLLMGGFVMFTRAAWEAAQGLDERYFLYCEEVDLFHRLAGMGHSFWRIAAARGYHEAGHGDGSSPTRLLYHAAGTAEFTHRHWSRPAAMIGSVLFWIAAVERYLAGRLLSRWIPRLKSLEKAYRLVACYPGLWRHGYHKQRGLMAQLKKRGGTPT